MELLQEYRRLLHKHLMSIDNLLGQIAACEHEDNPQPGSPRFDIACQLDITYKQIDIIYMNMLRISLK